MNGGYPNHGPENDKWFIRTYDDEDRLTIFRFSEKYNTKLMTVVYDVLSITSKCINYTRN
jgi:hypothetical protein